ncbi:hypothetical protein F6R98_15115 [Candidatus Methylospira mobilis]|uniref:Uncharacterized protein n=1 Tax=Candidatus Methylospira mobilis TaxID=1808979 RepID=A0A5Q0BKY4_9GAMM|nr:hypothetical protein [Candidatus Methylospira mobilis]QFY43792.1 hypothetical protein F6R98_15115 [Candidatus Methylospira mobilis]WNV04781.1 hypothetical protein RP726_20700 [Candidatus Methylospira mobilis]
MHKASVSPIHSPEFTELCELFNKLEQPYGLKEILHFNQIYERIYWNLRREERRRAEMLVDSLIDGLETAHLAARIFGVV